MAIVGLLWATGAPAVDPALVPAWETLGALHGRQGTPIGVEYHRVAGEMVAAIVVSPSPTASFLAGWNGAMRHVVVSPGVIGEDHRAAVGAIVYGLRRAEQDARLPHLSCIEREADALGEAARVWALSWPEGQLPRLTSVDARLSALAKTEETVPGLSLRRWVEREPAYRELCGRPAVETANSSIWSLTGGSQAGCLGRWPDHAVRGAGLGAWRCRRRRRRP